MAEDERGDAVTNLMTVDGHSARIEHDPDLDIFRGEILGLTGGADFYGKTPEELRREFRKSLEVFLEVCEEKGVGPYRSFSGRFNLRIPSRLHQRLAVAADSRGKSLNQYITETLDAVVD